MIRFIAKRYAKARYRFKQEVEAETNELHAKLAERLAKEKRTNAAQLTKEAEQMEARIKEVEEMENKGYYLCEDGHEAASCDHAPMPEDYKECDDCAKKPGSPYLCADCLERRSPSICIQCGKPTKLIKRDQMTGQEKYESDKERGDAQDIAKQKRDQAKAEEDSAVESDKAAKYFRSLSQNNRSVANKIRAL